VDTAATLQVQGTDYIWAAGDNAQVPDLVGRKAGNPNAWCPPNAQHAMRQAKVLGDNVISGMRGFPQKEYSHANKGAVAGLGLHKGVAMIVMGKMKIKLKGRLAWYMHRGYHGMAMPTYNRKIRVIAEWTINMFQKRDITALGALESPREEFYEAAKPAPAPAAKAEEKKVEEKAKAS
jgi:NADH dehydrogenase